MATRIVDLTTNEYSIREDTGPQEPEFRQGEVRDLEASIEPPQLFRKALHGPFKNVDLTKDVDKKGLIRGLTIQIPMNELDLPLYIYRPDMLDHYRIGVVLKQYADGQSVQDGMVEITSMLDAAGVILDYSQGYPSLPNGTPFWDKMDTETVDAYNMFVSYLELDGLRKLSELGKHYPMHFLQEFYHTNYWIFRARAFDLYRVANAQRQKLNRLLNTEDRHYKLAEKVLTKLDKYFDSVDWEELVESMPPDKAVGMLEKLVSVSRISIGLPKSGESKEKDNSRVMASAQQLIAQGAGGSERGQSAIDESFEDLLEDPESIALAQDLILRRQAGGKMD